MIGTSDGEQFEDSFDHAIATLRGVSSHINPDRFHEALQTMPLSKNIEDRRGEVQPPKRRLGQGGQPFNPVTGQLEPGNIDLKNRPVVKNADGSISTVRSMSFNEDDQEILIPTVHPEGRIMNADEAITHYRITGQHLGKFDTPENADAYAQQLHLDQEKQYGP